MKNYLVRIPLVLLQEWEKYNTYLKRDACIESILTSPQAMSSASRKPLKAGKYENFGVCIRLQKEDATADDIRHAFMILVTRCQDGILDRLTE